MTTEIKVKYSEQSKSVTAETSVSSDELSREEVMKLAKEIAVEAQNESAEMRMKKERRG